MPAEENTAPVTETVEQQSEDAQSEREIESMLGRIPGLDQYFGDETSEQKEALAEEVRGSSFIGAGCRTRRPA